MEDILRRVLRYGSCCCDLFFYPVFGLYCDDGIFSVDVEAEPGRYNTQWNSRYSLTESLGVITCPSGPHIGGPWVVFRCDGSITLVGGIAPVAVTAALWGDSPTIKTAIRSSSPLGMELGIPRLSKRVLEGGCRENGWEGSNALEKPPNDRINYPK